jgi:hypothetical protein
VTRKGTNPGKRGVRELAPGRLAEAEKMLAEPRPQWKIAADLAHRWRLSRRQAHRYLAAVKKRWAEEAEENRAHTRNVLRTRMETLLEKAWETSDLRAAAYLTDRLARLDGLYQDQLVVSGQIGVGAAVVALSREQLQERIRELAAQHPELIAHVPAKQEESGE